MMDSAQVAMHVATEMVDRLRSNTIFAAVCVVDDDGQGATATLNIYAPEEEWPSLRMLLSLTEQVERSVEAETDQYVTYTKGPLSVSLIELGGTNESCTGN